MHNGHFAKFNLIVFLKNKLIIDNCHHNSNKFPRINMKLINLLKKITDNDHHKSNNFSQITMKSIYLFLKNDIKTNIIKLGYNNFPGIFIFWMQN